MRAVRRVRIERSDGGVVCACCLLAERPWTRMRGLLGRRELASDEGVLLRPASSIHTWFMRFPIDVVFLDREGTVLALEHCLPPWRIRARRRAVAVLELAAGAAERAELREGERLLFIDSDRPHRALPG